MSDKIGRFEIRRELGRGAQSVVYLGFDPQLQREIAIKTLHFDHPNKEQNKALLNEARMVSKLRHPNIVPIFEAGEEDGDLYLVFEYVPGKSLADFMRDTGSLSPVRAISILQPVLEAVACAHAQGIIHRDLKPSNIILDENGMPRVMDFGIATRQQGANEEAESYTGTPAYMAPEYIHSHEVSERTDVFAAGLILFELLTGRRAVEGDNLFKIIHHLANEDVRMPDNIPGSDERIAALLHKAVARDPALRYQTVNQFLEALGDYLEPAEIEPMVGGSKQSTIDFLLRRMRHKSDFPALSESVGAINKIASSELESVDRLSNSILKDFALTNKLLRLVNSAYYRPAGGGSISTISRAVLVLGFETVRNIAITVLLFEHLQNKGNANQLKEEFLRANLAGILAKDIAAAAQMKDLEQVFICALFHNLGRLLAQYYFAEESEEIRQIVAQNNVTEDKAAFQVLGLSFENLGLAIARQWGFPPLIVNSMRKLPAGPVRAAHAREECLQVLSSMANELCASVSIATAQERDKEIRRLISRFKETVSLDESHVRLTMKRAIEEVEEFAGIIHLNMKQTLYGRQIRAFVAGDDLRSGEGRQFRTGDDALDQTVIGESDTLGFGTVGNDEVPDAQAILTAGIQDISNALVDGCKLNDMLRIILEIIYRAMGFKHVILCVKDTKAGCMVGRYSFGKDTSELNKHFRIPLAFTPDVFHAAISKGVDILISDIDDPKIATRIPDWYRKNVAARSFILFPLNIKNNPVALIYADKDEPIVVPEKELSLLRTLRNQAVLAIKQGS